MYPHRSYLRPLLLSAALLTGCGEAPTNAPAEILWPERQSIFRLDGKRARLEVFSIRGGVTPLGTVALPAAFCPTTMALDATGNRLWLWNAREGVVIDARSLKVLRQWQSAATDPTGVPASLRTAGQALALRAGCDASGRTQQAMTELD